MWKLTAQQLEEIVEGANKEQAQGVEQINSGIEQIDEVTQANTASSEESASASEEPASQAGQVKGMLERFKLSNAELRANQTTSQGQRTRRASQTARQPVKTGAKREGVLQKAGVTGGNGHGNEDQKQLRPDEVINLDDSNFDRF